MCSFNVVVRIVGDEYQGMMFTAEGTVIKMVSNGFSKGEIIAFPVYDYAKWSSIKKQKYIDRIKGKDSNIKKVGITVDIFDLLHAGNIMMLAEANRLVQNENQL